ncbi:MAG: sugar porter family MFS transporter [Bacteroidales bacterium]|nr:sugar porter family MFS transporter [Bacteroidales bacterium]
MKHLNKGFVYFICMVSAMGGLLFGYDWVVIGGAKPFYEQFFQIANDPFMQGWAMSVALLGCLIGAMLSGVLADRFGRKKLLIVSALIFLVSAYYTGAASSFTIFLIARFLGGIGIGIASNLSPMYIAEVSPSAIRGKLVSLNQLTIVLGILGAQIVNWLLAEPVPADYTAQQIAESWNGTMGWRWMFWAAAFPAGLFFLLVFFIPESPRWLYINGYKEKALAALTKIGGNDYAQEEATGIEMGQLKKADENGGLKKLFSRPMRKVLVIGVVIAVFQQWCGTNVIFNYAQEIFQSAGFTLNDVLFNIVITGIANLVFTFVAIFTVDRLGRRALMKIGAGGLAGIYLILGTCYFFEISGWFMVVLVVMAIACYAMSLGPVTWVLLSEIFPNSVRGVAMAVCTFGLWAGCFTLTYTFPLLNAFLGSSGTFWIYSLICIGGFIFIQRELPETKGKSLETLEKELIK